MRESGAQGQLLDLRIIEPERGSCLIYRDLARDFGYVLVESSSDIIVIAEDECLLAVEANCNDVLCVLQRKLVCLLRLELVLEKELFVI